MASSLKPWTISDKRNISECESHLTAVGRQQVNASCTSIPVGPALTVTSQISSSRNQPMTSTNLFVGRVSAHNQPYTRNTLVITNSDYTNDQRGLSGITFRNEICLGLPTNITWNELLHERPSDASYLRNLLDCTRTLNREYKKRRKQYIGPNKQDRADTIIGMKLQESYVKKKSINNGGSKEKIGVETETRDSLVGDRDERSDVAAVGHRGNEEDKTSRSMNKITDERLAAVTVTNSASLTSPAKELRLENLVRESWPTVEDDDEELEDNSEKIYRNMNALLSKLNVAKKKSQISSLPDGTAKREIRSSKSDNDEAEHRANDCSKGQEKLTSPTLEPDVSLPAINAKKQRRKKKKKNAKDREILKDIDQTESPSKPDDENMAFDDYYDEKTTENGIRNGTMYQDILRINSKNSKEAYINCPLDNKDIFIDGIKDRNRALDGDDVVVELYSEDKWKWHPDKTHQKCGKVVAIVQRNHPRTAVGYLKIVYGKSSGIILWPRDNRLPRIRIAEDTCPPKFRIHHQRYKATLFLAKIVSWDTIKSATGIVLRELGDENSINVESECILLENNLSPDSPVNEADLSAFCDDISEMEVGLREDFRKQCVFTIDPPSARDLDDALSWRRLPNGNAEVGIHIADVTHYLLNETPLDNDVRQKATSVYLVEKVYHMLPLKLCQICSLLPSQDKLAFSVFIELNESADIIKHRFSKTVIRSCAQLSYDHAQKVIDKGEELLDEYKFPSVNNGYTEQDCAKAIWELHALAMKMRRRRFSQGALRIDQPKVMFQLNESKQPTSYTLYEGKESNWLVEEFMLLANILVANKIREVLPHISLLRYHAAPKEKSLSTVIEYLEKVGIHIDTSSAGNIYKSMMSYNCSDEIGAARMTVIMHLLVKPMMRARYTCSAFASSLDNYPDLWHYALNTPFYTHFTSPIRRYADVVVHRLLAGAIEFAETPKWTCDDIQRIAVNCNNKKNAAKKASEQSTELFLKWYIEKNGPEKERAVVIEVREKCFDVIGLSTRFVSRIYVNKMENIECVDFNNGNGVPTLKIKLRTREELLYVQIFSVVNVELLCKKMEDKYYGNNSLHHILL